MLARRDIGTAMFGDMIAALPTVNTMRFTMNCCIVRKAISALEFRPMFGSAYLLVGDDVVVTSRSRAI